MRKWIIAGVLSLAALVCAVEASAQDNILFDDNPSRSSEAVRPDANEVKVRRLVPGIMVYKSGSFYISGRELSREEIRDYVGWRVYNDTYEQAIRQYRTGSSMFYAGTAAFVGGILLMNYLNRYYRNTRGTTELQALCAIGSVAGFLTASVGIPIWAVGAGRLRRVASDYNKKGQAPDISMNIGACPSGIGLSLVF